MKPAHLAMIVVAAVGLSAPAYADKSHADPNAPKAVGDGKDDLAPLSTGNTPSTPLDNANFPPAGGATMSGGPNPLESGIIDADKAAKKK